MELKSLIVPVRSTVPALTLASLSLVWNADAAPVSVGNASFELPSTTFVNPQIDLWNKTPQPDWFQSQNGVTWEQMSGVFANTAPGSPSHIVNIDGNQAAYIISLPQAGITQVVSGKYEAGLQYSVSVGVIAGGNITEGTSLLVGLFYVDDAGVPVTVAGKTVTYTAAGFPNSIEFQDQKAVSSVLKSGDAAVGRNIGIQIVGTGGDGAGYWDVDNVRVSANTVPEPGTWALFTLGLAGLLTVGRRSVVRR
ncbi:MAG: PEP-CTERM sorting domain-containing protein [Verrucomicrobiota bacterium]